VAISKIAALFFLGFFLGPVGDFFHVYTGTTGYPPDKYGLYFFGIPFWVPILFGVASTAIGISLPRMDLWLQAPTSRPGAGSLAPALLGVFGFLGLYILSGFLPKGGHLSDVTLITAAACFWFFLDRTWQGIILGLLTALVGSAVEIGLVQLGAFYYGNEDSSLWGVASWLPWLYFTASIGLGNFGRYLFGNG
jgi:hypothetical protein